MSEAYYERLTPLDATFLLSQDENAHMHVGSVSTFDARPLTKPDGGLDFDSIKRAISVMLERNPRMRQKVWWPAGGPPVWIDDMDFRLSYHLRHTALPLPGTDRHLKRLAGRVMSQTLDITKPLWEIWIVEGLCESRFAILAKLHHCLADGIGARDILTGYLNVEPTPAPNVADTWRPRPAPSLARIQLEGAQRRIEKVTEAWGSLGRYFKEDAWRDSLSRTTRGMVGAMSNFVGDVSPTPLNRRIGPHRRFDWAAVDFDQVRAIRKGSGAKVNDIVLACVTGAMRRFLLQRRLQVDELDFRVMVPVNVRSDAQDGQAGNRVSSMIVPIPLFETDPGRRLKRILSTTARIKASSQSDVGELVAQFLDAAGIYLPQNLTQRAAQRLASNIVVTNVPGPLFPIYLNEAVMLESFPLVPLVAQQGLGIALYSYNKALHWGFNGDWDLVPDLHDIAGYVIDEFAHLVSTYVPLDVSRVGEALSVVEVAPAASSAQDAESLVTEDTALAKPPTKPAVQTARSSQTAKTTRSPSKTKTKGRTRTRTKPQTRPSDSP